MTYLVLDLVFVAVAAVVLVVAVARGVTGDRRALVRRLAITLAVLLAMTAVFDNLMISAGLVAYDDANRLGWSIGVAPVEDFAYPVAGVLLLPALWHLLGARDPRGRTAGPGTRGRLGP